MSQPSILLVGYDPRLLTARSAVLQDAGFHVDCTHNAQQAASACSSKSYSAVLLCTSIPRDEAESMVQSLKMNCPAPSFLNLSAWDDIGLMEIRKPEFLLTIVRSVLSGQHSAFQDSSTRPRTQPS